MASADAAKGSPLPSSEHRKDPDTPPTQPCTPEEIAKKKAAAEALLKRKEEAKRAKESVLCSHELIADGVASRAVRARVGDQARKSIEFDKHEVFLQGALQSVEKLVQQSAVEEAVKEQAANVQTAISARNLAFKIREEAKADIDDLLEKHGAN